MKRSLLLLLFLFWVGCLWGATEAEEEREVYHILQKGFITVAGKTNFFDFSGQALRHEGELVEENHRYTGHIRLRFSELHFSLPGVQAVLEEESYINAKKYPEITIDLDNFHPSEQPTRIKSLLRLRGVERPIEIQTRFHYLSPVVKVEGSFQFKQSDFGVKPYSKGLMDINDVLEVKFKAFFC